MLAGGAQDQKYNQLYGQNAQRLRRPAKTSTKQLYSQAGNPYFEQAVQQQADKTAADVQRQFGGLGRIGSAADTGALVDQIGNMRTQAMANNWNQNIANQRGILGDQSSLYGNLHRQSGQILSGQAGAQQGALAAAPGAYNQQFLPARAWARSERPTTIWRTRQLQSQIDTLQHQSAGGLESARRLQSGDQRHGGHCAGLQAGVDAEQLVRHSSAAASGGPRRSRAARWSAVAAA